MQLNVLSVDGKAGGGVDVAEAAFGVPFNEALVHQVVVAYQAGARAGTKAQRNRALVRGGGSKPHRQKGTGRARAGTIRSPLWRGGGMIFAAVPRDYAQKVNRKMYRSALRAILSELIRQERLTVVEDLSMAAPKTKELAARLAALDITDVLLVTEAVDDTLALAARNLPGVEVCSAAQINPVSLILHNNVLCTVGALNRIQEVML